MCRLKYRKFELREGDPGGIEKIIEHSDRNDKKSTDIAICQFNRDENTIFVQFHYDDDCITSTTKLFTKPPRNEEETSFNSKEIEGYVANPWTTQLNDLELYYMLQELLKREEKSVDSYHTRETEIREILQIRIQQIEVPLLKFSIFDPLRNESARKLRLHRVNMQSFSVFCLLVL